MACQKLMFVGFGFS